MTNPIIWHEEEWSLSKLKKFDKNPRKITQKQLEILKNGIGKLGYHHPIAIQPDGLIISGHQRAECLRDLGYDKIRVSIPSRPLDDDEYRQMLIQANVTNGEFDLDLLSSDFTVDELEVWGLPEQILSKVEKPQDLFKTDKDDAPAPPSVAVTARGDVWILGEHRLRCGDSTSISDIEDLMQSKKADMVFTDPPYNVDYGANANHPSHKIRTIKNDKMSDADWNTFVRGYLATLFRYCDGNMYISMSDKELGHLQNCFVELGGKWASFIIWVKDSLVLSAKDYHSRHETILFGWKDGVKARQRVEDRTQDDVWEIPRPKTSDEHPTMKPVDLVERAIRNSSRNGQVVLDLFGGSGTTLIAAEKTGRVSRLMELDEKYCDVIVRRWMNFTGKKAYREKDGMEFPG